MAAVIGNNVMLYWHRTDVDPEVDVAFACSTNCTFNVNVDQKEVTSQSSAWFREFKNDVASWSVTCDGLITLTGFSYLFMLDKQLTREPIEVKFVVDNGVDGLVWLRTDMVFSNKFDDFVVCYKNGRIVYVAPASTPSATK